jgi:hypothetical protein
MSDEIQILSEASNMAIVRLPGRRFPGVVVQGDTLKSLCEVSAELVTALQEGNNQDAVEAATYLREALEARLKAYEAVLTAAGEMLPYSS